MTLDEFKKQQSKSLQEFKHLKKTDPEKARKEAFNHLYGAKLIDKNYKLRKQYR